ESFSAAAAGYASQNNAVDAAEMRNNQSVALLQAGDAQAAYDAAAGTGQIFETAGDAKRQAMALGNMAAALDELGRLQEAEDAYQKSAKLFTEIGEDKLHANVMQSISKLQLRSGRQLEAIASMQSGLEEIKKPSIKQKLLKKLLKSPFKLLDR
ncbi:MAG: tetratricopeptide repeat protein, partial [Chloroflexota bacterium]